MGGESLLDLGAHTRFDWTLVSRRDEWRFTRGAIQIEIEQYGNTEAYRDVLLEVMKGAGFKYDLVAGTTTTFGTQGSDTVANIENLLGTFETDEFTGNDADNFFIGYQKVDELNGGNGDDLLEPLNHADIVDGGEGADTIVYAAAPRPVTLDLVDQVTDALVEEIDHPAEGRVLRLEQGQLRPA